MKEYEFVKVQLGSVMAFLVSESEPTYREIIREMGAKGYRYVGYLPSEMTAYGRITEADLVFEKEEW